MSKNTTIVLEESLLEEARAHAAALDLSFNAWVAKLIASELRQDLDPDLEKLFSLADACAKSSRITGNSPRWTRDEIYERG